MANDENKIILEFPATNVEIEFGETITFDNISGFLNSDRVTYNGESLTEEIAHLENDKADNTKIAPEYDEEETYYRGDIVLYNGVLYECDNTDASGEFNPSDWKEITLGEGIENVRDLLADYYTKSQSDYRFLGKTNPSGTGYFSLNRRGSAGAYSVSVGRLNEASAQSSFAEGENNASSGYASHSEGYGNNASGLMAHAEGVTTESSGYGSHSEGVGTIANHIGQHVIGTYNVADTSTADTTAKGNYIEIVGNGTDDNRRRNARTLDWSGNETLAGNLTFNGNKSLTSEISRLDGKIDNLPAPMIFKGTLGVGGTIESLPTASAENEGWTFKCITAGTYAGLTLKVGDTVTCFNPPNTSTYYWDKTGSQDTDTDTWRNIKVNGIEKLDNGISSGAVDFEDTANVKFEFDADGNKISATLDGIYTDSEVDDLLDDKADADNTYTKEQVDDIVYNILPDDTASGSVANFTTSLELPIKSLEVDVNAKQDLHGYDYPWTAGGGKNVYPPITPDTKNGITLTNDNGVITINGTATADTYFDIDNLNISLPSGSKLYLCAFNSVAAETRLSLFLITNNIDNPQVNMNNANAILDTTISTDAIGTRLRFRVPNGATYSNFKLSPYLQIGGDTPTSFAPYENICPIEGWSEINIVGCGKNLLDNDDFFNFQSWKPNLVTVGEFPTNYSNKGYKLPTKVGETYTISFGIDENDIPRYVYLCKTDGITSTRVAYITTGSSLFNRTYTFTSDGSLYYLRSGSMIDQSAFETQIGKIAFVELELGSTATEYEPYVGNEYIINLGGTYYGGHFTQDEAGHRQFEVTWCALTDLGSLPWGSASNGRIGCNPTDMAVVSSGAVIGNIKSDCYAPDTQNNVYNRTNDKTIAMTNNLSTRMMLYDSDLGNKTSVEVKAALSGKNVIYGLLEPYTIDLPDGEPIITLNGTNNIYADTGDTSVVFKDSVNGYVEKKIASAQALALNT